ncbi:FIVAR domain-containing protein [Anaerococcus sp. mt242]|uniref:FIVAR domain-containing protein n=1 Tax=Anaerococcus sp. mt242 TaxID=2661917 RepID=UPI0019320DE4|nr:FIVAR domain-containing protein [Anaerococcus sp. mt242]MBM0045641.1 FIVAR domain-containing protein [Anaerococcus sp. mt242]
MKNKILKTSAVLALGTLLLVPSTNNVYAASTDTSVSTEMSEVEKEFRQKLEEVNQKIVQYDSVLMGYEFKNADEKPQLQYTNALKGLKEGYESLINYKTENDDFYRLYINQLNSRVELVENAKANLNGREVDKSELIKLTTEQSNFQASDAYKNAPKELKEKYDAAVQNAWKTVGDNGLNLTNLQNELAINAVQSAKNEIIANDERKKALDSLREEIAKTADIRAEKDIYTDSSYNTYNNAAILAKSTIENPNSSLDEIKSARDLVQSARNNLAKKQTQGDIDRQKQIERLEEAIRQNKETRESVLLIKKIAPNIATKNAKYLDQLIKRSEDIVARSTKVLNQLKGIRG